MGASATANLQQQDLRQTPKGHSNPLSQALGAGKAFGVQDMKALTWVEENDVALSASSLESRLASYLLPWMSST